MANILIKTEQFDDTGVWTPNDSLTVTANTDAAPGFAGPSAGLADTLDDAQVAAQASLTSGYQGIANDGTDWLLSLHVKKDSSTTRFPYLYLDLVNGTRLQTFASIDTKNGLITTASGLPAFDATGVVDVDAVYWRFWARVANNNTGNTAIRCGFFPAATSAHGGAADNSAQGNLVAWGANLTNTSAIQAYEPDPFYAFPRSFLLVR